MSAQMQKRLFITFEGGDGAGKTTQIRRLSQFLTQQGIDHITTREPGGAPFSEKLRDVMLDEQGRDAQPLTQALLMTAARFEHVTKVIQPALEKGQWVLSDRFLDSTTVYQGFALGVPQPTIMQLHQMVLGNFKPDITFVFRLRPHLAEKRGSSRQQNHYDLKDLAFRKRVMQGFDQMIEDNPLRCIGIDAEQSFEHITAFIREALVHHGVILDKTPS